MAVRFGRLATASTWRTFALRGSRGQSNHYQRRCLQTDPKNKTRPQNIAFAFDIDGVLLRSAEPIPRASRTLQYLQKQRIPFILLTNGGGKKEQERVDEISQRLGVPLDTKMFIQSHTPFAEMVHGEQKHQDSLKDKCVLVVGGDKDKCRHVAEGYGFTNVVIPGDLITAFPSLMPFSSPSNYSPFSRPLPPSHKTLSSRDSASPTAIKIDAILVFNDSRDWALDAQLILDLLLSRQGYLGSLSPLNDTPSLPNRGYQQDGQPQLYFSNPDLLWAAEYHLPRLGQGGFKEALIGVWNAVTGGPSRGVALKATMFGKPNQGTYEFAEKRLRAHREDILTNISRGTETGSLDRVYMIGDNPESDIAGANTYVSPFSSHWTSILVRSGVYSGKRPPAHEPQVTVDDVWDAMVWALEDSGWSRGDILP